MMYRFPLFLIMSLITFGTLLAQLPVGTVRKSTGTDPSGYIVNNPLIYSNQFTVIYPATNANQIVRFAEFTNSVYNATNTVTPLKLGGTGVATTQLVGSWTNTINYTVGGTNQANAYQVKGQLGFTGVITNMAGTGVSNVTSYCDGIVTNSFLIP